MFLIVSAVLIAGAVTAARGFEATSTGKVPVEGALSTNNQAPRPGDVILLYLTVTALQPAATLSCAIHLPPGVTAVEGAPLEQAIEHVAANQSVTVTTAVRVGDGASKTIEARATLRDTPELALARTFTLVLNSAPPTPSSARAGTDAHGNPLIIYDGRQ